MPNYENLKLFRIVADEVMPIDSNPKSQQSAYLVPFRMLSISGFKFPFSNPVRIREAIKLQTVSYSGGNSIQIFPIIVNKSSKEASGFSFFVPDNELTDLEKSTGNASSPVFPAVLSLASCVDGNGITIWMDEKNICGVIWRSGVPELYRWHANKESALDSEIDWLKKYCESKEIELNNDVYIFDAEKESGELLPIIKQSLASFSWLKEMNLSRGAINSVMILERFVRLSSKAAIWLTVFGLVYMVGAWMNYSTISEALTSTRINTEKVYRDVFNPERNETIRDAVSQARGKINMLKGAGSTVKSLSDVLTDLGVNINTNSTKITIDSLSYSNIGTNIEASAADTAIITSFSSALTNNIGASSVRTGQIIPIPGGGGFRFNLIIEW